MKTNDISIIEEFVNVSMPKLTKVTETEVKL